MISIDEVLDFKTLSTARKAKAPRLWVGITTENRIVLIATVTLLKITNYIEEKE